MYSHCACAKGQLPPRARASCRRRNGTVPQLRVPANALYLQPSGSHLHPLRSLPPCCISFRFNQPLHSGVARSIEPYPERGKAPGASHISTFRTLSLQATRPGGGPGLPIPQPIRRLGSAFGIHTRDGPGRRKPSPRPQEKSPGGVWRGARARARAASCLFRAAPSCPLGSRPSTRALTISRPRSRLSRVSTPRPPPGQVELPDDTSGAAAK